jgi:4-hydroxybenzoyl-CoA thioesterase
MAAFQREIPVRFGHCDPATIVFYPRYFEMISALVEDWFEDGLEASAPGLMYHRGIVTPTVHFTVDFLSAAWFGDRLTFNLWVKKIGRTSCELFIEASHQGTVAMRVRQILVFMMEKTRKATPIAPDIVHRMKRFMHEADKKAQPRVPPKAVIRSLRNKALSGALAKRTKKASKKAPGAAA